MTEESNALQRLGNWTEYLDATGESMLTADGFDDAFMGVSLEWGPPRAVYSYDKCVEMLRRDMNYEEAVEYMDFNVVGAYVGEQTPVFVREDAGVA